MTIRKGPITRTMLATARAISADAVDTYLAETRQQVWQDSAGREWKPLSTGEEVLWAETVVTPLTRSEVEEHFGRLTAGAAKFTSREDDPTVIDNDTWARLAGQPAAVIAAELGEDVANAAGLFCGLGDAQPHDRTTCPGWHA